MIYEFFNDECIGIYETVTVIPINRGLANDTYRYLSVSNTWQRFTWTGWDTLEDEEVPANLRALLLILT